MAYENVNTRSFVSTNAQNLVTNQFTFQKIDSNGQIVACGSGQYSYGVLQDKPLSALDPGAVCRPGDITKVQAGGSFSAGQDVSSDASGNAIAATSGAQILGTALTAGVSGYLAVIVYQPKGKM